MTYLSGVLALVCLAVAALHLLRLVVLRSDPLGEATHAAMAVGMAAMFSPFGDPVPAPAWAAVFVLCGAWFAVHALREGTLWGHPGHHVVGSGAMLFMLLSGHSHAPGSGGQAHAGHLAHGPDDVLGVGSLAAIVLAGYFAWHVLRCVDRMEEAAAVVAPTAGGAVAVRAPAVRDTAVRAPAALQGQAVALAHVVMAVGMTVMLLGMV